MLNIQNQGSEAAEYQGSEKIEVKQKQNSIWVQFIIEFLTFGIIHGPYAYNNISYGKARILD